MARRSNNKYGTTNTKKIISPDGYESKNPRIRWKQGEKSELARRVRNAQQKRRRAIKAGVPESALPPAIRGRELKKVIETRADLKRELANIERFMKADLKTYKDYKYIKISDYEMQEALRLAEIGNRALAKEKARIERHKSTIMGERNTYSTAKGKVKDFTIGQMGNIEKGVYAPVNVEVGNKERWQWNRYMDMLRKRADPEYVRKKNYQLQLNYATGLLRNFGNDPFVLKLIDEIFAMEPSDFVVKYYQDTDVSRIEYIYDDKLGSFQERLLKMYNHFTNGNLDEYDPSMFDTNENTSKTKWFLQYYDDLENGRTFIY